VAEHVALEVPATPDALGVVRMVLGGLGAQLDFSLEQLDDLFLASERLLRAALAAESPDRLQLDAEVDGPCLRVTVGPFFSAGLRERVACSRGRCLDLCTLLRGTLDEVAVEPRGEGFAVVMVKRAGSGGR